MFGGFDFPLVAQCENAAEAEWETGYFMAGINQHTCGFGPPKLGNCIIDGFFAMSNDPIVSKIITVSQLERIMIVNDCTRP